MATKRRRAAKKRKPTSAKTRASDDELRERLRNVDLRALDQALAKAVRSARK